MYQKEQLPDPSNTVAYNPRTSVFPSWRLRHLVHMTDNFGLFQHAVGSDPDLRHGYCVDDNARAAIVAAQLTLRGNAIGKRMLPVYLAFMERCQQENGLFCNFVNADGSFAETIGSPDSQGRTIWAAGALAGAALTPDVRTRALSLLDRAIPQVDARFLRTQAFILLGLVAVLQGKGNMPRDLRDHVALQTYEQLVHQFADNLVAAFEQTATVDWAWYEPVLTYCNARLPQALYAAATVSDNPRYRQVADTSLAFLHRVHFRDSWLQLVGCDGWYERNGVMARYDQQPVDAGVLAETFCTAVSTTGEWHYRAAAKRCLDWYHGYNSDSLPMYIPETGACYDGLKPGTVNQNQGAESMLSYYLARLAYEALFMNES